MKENEENNLESPFLSNSFDSTSNDRLSKNNDKDSFFINNESNNNINNNLYSSRNTVSPNAFFNGNIKANNNFIFGKFDPRKTYNQSNSGNKETLFRRRLTQFLLKTSEKKKKLKNKDVPKDLLNIFYDNEEDEESEEIEDANEYNLYHKDESSTKLKSIVQNLIKTKRSNEWNEYMDTYKKRVKESQTLRYKLKTIFHIDSDFIVIWKTTLRIFHIFILFIFLFRYLILTLEENDEVKKRILTIYNMVNIMFCIDLLFSVLILIFNGGSRLTYFKLPLKIYTCIPFSLKKDNFYYLLPKFLRIDIFQKIFSSWESYINLKVELNIHNYNLKIFITCITQMIKYLLIFGLYAHINCCILSYFDGMNYASSLFYTIEAFTVIGFGEHSPENKKSVILVVLNLFIGVNLFSLMSSNIKTLSKKINDFNRDISLNDNYEYFTFNIQKSIGRILPNKINQSMISYLLFRRGLSFNDLKEEFKDVLDSCKNSLVENILEQVFKFLKLEFQYFFPKLDSEDFMLEIFQNLKPKIFKANQTLIKCGEKVNKLYFLLNGQIYATDGKNKPIFTMINNSIFGEYEFITNTLSCFNIIVDPNTPAYGFVLDKKQWEKISKNHISIANSFIKQIVKKRKKHMQWINDDTNNNKNKNLFEPLPEIKEEINIFNSNNENIININNEKNRKNKNIGNEDINYIKKSNNRKSNLSNNKKFSFSDIDIIRNIDELHKEINKIEFNFLDSKNLLLNNLRQSYL